MFYYKQYGTLDGYCFDIVDSRNDGGLIYVAQEASVRKWINFFGVGV